jgi:energy-coupling factor transport system ATP-binding protein
VPAIRDVTMTLEPGEVLCVAGSNGSGKSTLARICAGIVTADSGTLEYAGEVIEGRKALRSLRFSVGLLFQSPEDQLFADTVGRDIAFGPRNRGLKGNELDRVVNESAEHVGLDIGLLERSPFSLSGGEKRRVALAGVLAMEPDVLALDEPFIGLDHEGREKLKDSLRRYRESRGASMLIVTHDLADAWPLADRFALLSDGELRALESKEELLESGADLAKLGMALPQWGELAKMLSDSGHPADDVSDPSKLADAAAEMLEANRGGR